MEKVNGKYYNLWGQFVDQRESFIGGTLQELEEGQPLNIVHEPIPTTRITDIRLVPNGTDSALFCVDGETWGCEGDVGYLGITAGEKGWITLSGFGGHLWRFKKPENNETSKV